MPLFGKPPWESENTPVRTVLLGDVELKPGMHVCLRPRRMADAMDLILSGRTATVEAIEKDFENRIHVAVVIDDDPGKDLGIERKPGHRFFYGLDEIEILSDNDVSVSDGGAP